MVITYALLQWKRCLKKMLQILIVVALVSLCIAGIYCVADRIMKAHDFSLIKVGLVVPEDELTTRYVTNYISSMDSVKSICSFEYEEEEEAIRKFNEGTLKAVIVLPSGFYHDVQVGINPPAVIYFPKNTNIAEKIFRELLISGVSYLQTAEASVYAALNTVYIYNLDRDVSEIGNTLALAYVDTIMSRDKTYKDDFVSVFGESDRLSYYGFGALILILMFFGICFSHMYEKSSKVVDDMMAVKGLGKIKLAIVHIFVMVPVIYVVGAVILTVEKMLFMNVTGTHYLLLLPLSVTMAVYFQIVYRLAGNSKSGILALCIINICGALVSGMIIPSDYLASWTKLPAAVLPMKYWMRWFL